MSINEAEQATKPLPQAIRPPNSTEISHLFILAEHEMARGRLAEALILYRLIKTLVPEHTDAAARYTLALFRREQWAEAWNEFEVRFRLMPSAPRVTRRDADGTVHDIARWRGGPLPTKLLVMDEQGLGDTIQFARFFKPLVEKGVEISFVTHAVLFDLLKSMDLPINLIPSHEPGQVRGIGGWTPLIDIPRYLGLSADDYEAHEPYIKADPALVKKWARRLKDKAFKMGLVWAGNPDSPAESGRSMALEALAPLAKIEGVRLYSLQKGEAAKELKSVSFKKSITDFGPTLDEGAQAFLDAAAIIQSLDLVVSVDTAVAHVAGALGKPVCLLLRKDPDWRWLARESDNVWYPKTRLYRQRQAQDWSEPVQRLAVDIAARLGKAAPPLPGVMPLVPTSVSDLVERIAKLNCELSGASTIEQAAELQHQSTILDAELRKISKDIPVMVDLERDMAGLTAKAFETEERIGSLDLHSASSNEIAGLIRSAQELAKRRAKLKRQIDDAAGSRFHSLPRHRTKPPVKNRR